MSERVNKEPSTPLKKSSTPKKVSATVDDVGVDNGDLKFLLDCLKHTSSGMLVVSKFYWLPTYNAFDHYLITFRSTLMPLLSVEASSITDRSTIVFTH
jgi:hypothetical protein